MASNDVRVTMRAPEHTTESNAGRGKTKLSLQKHLCDINLTSLHNDDGDNDDNLTLSRISAFRATKCWARFPRCPVIPWFLGKRSQQLSKILHTLPAPVLVGRLVLINLSNIKALRVGGTKLRLVEAGLVEHEL